MDYRPHGSRSHVMALVIISLMFLPALTLAQTPSQADGVSSRSFQVSIASHPDLDEDEIHIFQANIAGQPSDIFNHFLFRWDYGDGGFDEDLGLTSVSHSYPRSGDYNIRLMVEDDLGVEYVATSIVMVRNVVPVPSIKVMRPSTFEDELVVFSAEGSWDTPSDLPLLTYSWTLPGEEPTDFTSQSLAKGTYSQAGTYSVLLRAKDNDGDIGYSTMSFRVDNQPPLAEAGKDALAFETTDIIFSGKGSLDTKSDMGSLEYSWDFGDGNTATGMTVTHAYDESGEYIAILTVTDDDGTVTRDQIQVTVMNLPPVAHATYYLEGGGSFAVFDASGSTDTVSDLETLDYAWTFADGLVKRGMVVTHRFDTVGTFKVTLGVEDHEGSSDTDTVTVTVTNLAPDPTMRINGLSVEDEPVTFDASGSEDPDGAIVHYEWDFGDGTTGLGPTVEHSYGISGEYNIVLTLTDDKGAWTDHEKTITVRNLAPEIEVEGDRIVTVGEEMVLDASGTKDTASDRGRLDFKWDFGDGTIGHGAAIRHAFQSLGDHDIRLTVTDDDGAMDEVVLKVRAVLASFWDSGPLDMVHITAWSDKQALDTNEAYTIRGDVEVHQDLVGFMTVSDIEVLVHVVETGVFERVRTDANGCFWLELEAPSIVWERITIEIVAAVGPFLGQHDLVLDMLPAPAPEPIVDPVFATASTASIALVALGLVGGTDIGRWKFFTLMIPLFTRISKPKVLDHFERGRIYEHIRKSPGDTYSSIRRALGIKNGALAHHLRILEMHDYIDSRRDGMYKRFYPKGMKVPEGKHKSIQERLLDLIVTNPSITQRQLAEDLGIDRSTVNYHIKILLAMGVIRSEKIGQIKHYYFMGVKDPVPYRA